GAKGALQGWERGVELGQGAGEARGVVAVAVEGVEVNQGGEDQTAAGGRQPGLERGDASGVVLGGKRFGDATPGEEVGDLADGGDQVARGGYRVEERRRGGR